MSMTENEIKIKLEVLKDWVGNVSLTRQDMQNVIDEAIQALEEIPRYRDLGTVDELAEMQVQYHHLFHKIKGYEAIGTVEEVKYYKRMLHLADMVVERSELIKAELANLLKCYRGDEDAKMKAFGFDEYIEKIIKMCE